MSGEAVVSWKPSSSIKCSTIADPFWRSREKGTVRVIKEHVRWFARLLKQLLGAFWKPLIFFQKWHVFLSAKANKGRHIQQSFPLNKVLPLSAVTPLCFSPLGLIIPFASLYHVLASSFFTTSPYLSWYLPLCRFSPPPPHLTFVFFFYHLALPPLCHFPALAHLSLSPSCAKCSFYRSQQSLSVRGPFSVHIGIKRQDKHSLELKLAGEDKCHSFTVLGSFFFSSCSYSKRSFSSSPLTQIYIVCGLLVNRESCRSLVSPGKTVFHR